MKKIINEFKEFIERGNVIDLAVGVVMGSAFSKIVSSVVDDLLMPVIGVVIGGIDFSSLKITFKNADIRYGLLLNNIINFLIISLCIFIIVKIINKLTRKKEVKKDNAVKEVKKSNEVILLEEIRDEIKKQNSVSSKKTTGKFTCFFIFFHYPSFFPMFLLFVVLIYLIFLHLINLDMYFYN